MMEPSARNGGAVPRQVRELIPEPLTLKIAIVEVLERRERKSCRLGGLTAAVLKHLHLDLRGVKRDAFEAVLKKSLSDLLQRKIVTKYKATTNVRIRLTPDYVEGTERLIDSHSHGTSARKARNGVLPFEGPQFEVEAAPQDLPRHPPPTLPELPPLDQDTFEPLTGEGDADVEDEEQADDDERRLLGILCPEEKAPESTSLPAPPGEPPVGTTSQGFLEDLSRALELLPMLEVRQLSSRSGLLVLQLLSTEDGESRSYLVRTCTKESRIVIETMLPYLEAASTQLLRAASDESFSATIAVSDFKGAPCLFVRKTLPASTDTVKGFLDHLLESDRSVSSAKKVLRGFE